MDLYISLSVLSNEMNNIIRSVDVVSEDEIPLRKQPATRKINNSKSLIQSKRKKCIVYIICLKVYICKSLLKRHINALHWGYLQRQQKTICVYFQNDKRRCYQLLQAKAYEILQNDSIKIYSSMETKATRKMEKNNPERKQKQDCFVYYTYAV